ncbi:MAG: toprim domain-containing protein, partial [Bradyrhizobium sp.]|nr:toprim domain-containing protein [Bradyrhizobium sp.]
AARRLFAISQPIESTLVQLYLRRRGIDDVHHGGSLRYQPRCYYHPPNQDAPEIWPAMIARVTDLDGTITGVHRTWLDPEGFDDRRLGKAPIDTPRRAMGDLLGHAARFGITDDVMAAGEGIETMLSLRTVLPSLPVAAALSANHLATLLWPVTLRRLYVAVDADAAGINAAKALTVRALDAGIEAIALCPRLGDFNEDLRAFGKAQLRDMLRHQLLPGDDARFLDVISA